MIYTHLYTLVTISMVFWRGGGHYVPPRVFRALKSPGLIGLRLVLRFKIGFMIQDRFYGSKSVSRSKIGFTVTEKKFAAGMPLSFLSFVFYKKHSEWVSPSLESGILEPY